jgi:VIT family
VHPTFFEAEAPTRRCIAQAPQGGVLLAEVAGLVAGAMSMAAGAYVSMSFQTDAEQAGVERKNSPRPRTRARRSRNLC